MLSIKYKNFYELQTEKNYILKIVHKQFKKSKISLKIGIQIFDENVECQGLLIVFELQQYIKNQLIANC